MAKRFIDTNIWDKGWFSSLDSDLKLCWFYLFTKCNHAGIYDVNMSLISFQLFSSKIKEIDLLNLLLKNFENKIEIFDEGNKWFIPSFINFQYGELNPINRAHKSVIDILNKEGLYKGLISPLEAYKDKAKDKDKAKVKDKDKDNIPKNQEKEAMESATLFNELRMIDEKMSVKDMEKWAVELYKLVKIDKESWNEVERVIRLVLADDFWKTVVHSPLKFRRKDKEGIRYWDKFKQLSKQNSKGRTQIQGNEDYNATKL